MSRRTLLASGLSLLFAASIALPALAEEGEGMMKKEKKARGGAVDTACMQTAVEKRENAIIAALDAYHTSVKTSLETRRDALKAAWGLADAPARNVALKEAWKAFKGTWKNAHKTLKEGRKAAWKTFKTERKACKGTTDAADPEAGGEGVDNQL